MNPDVTEAKRRLRRAMEEQRARTPMEELIQASAQLCQRMRQEPVWQSAGAVMLFYPVKGEPDIRPLLAEALSDGRRVVLPRFVKERDAYEGAEVLSLEALRPGHFGILEPPPECATFALNRLDLTLVPGVAFDCEGCRLGRGKGYYDRLLRVVGGLSCGVAFDWQLVPAVPVHPHDVRLNLILTPSRWLRCSGARGGL